MNEREGAGNKKKGFLYTQVLKEESSLITGRSRKGRVLESSNSNVNWMWESTEFATWRTWLMSKGISIKIKVSLT